jgi:Xaa-Pro dipeptidase
LHRCALARGLAEMDPAAQQLLAAQQQAAALFDAVIAQGLIQPGKLESEVSADIHALARAHFGVRRHWHQRVVRAGSNTMLGYGEDSEDRRIEADDVVFLDFGPVFNSWEADYGRTYVLGTDPRKHQLVHDLAAAFKRGKALFEATPGLTAGELYDFVSGLARPGGWEFGSASAGHPIGHFPHEGPAGGSRQLTIEHGNDLPLRLPDRNGNVRHWILEIHLIDRARQYGGFLEELLTC